MFRAKSYTLIEILTVLLIIGILATMATTYTSGYNKRVAKETFCASTSLLQVAINNFARENKRLPNLEEVNNIIIHNNFQNKLINPYTENTITVLPANIQEAINLGTVMYDETTGRLITNPSCIY